MKKTEKYHNINHCIVYIVPVLLANSTVLFSNLFHCFHRCYHRLPTLYKTVFVFGYFCLFFTGFLN